MLAFEKMTEAICSSSGMDVLEHVLVQKLVYFEDYLGLACCLG